MSDLADNLNNIAEWIERGSPPPGILICDRFDRGPQYGVLREYGTRDWLLAFTQGGQGSYRVGDEEQVCEPGDIFVLRPGTEHNYRTGPAGRWEFDWVHFVPRPEWADLLLLPELAPGLLAIRLEPESGAFRRASAAFERMIRDTVTGGALQERLAFNALEELLLTINAHAGAAGRKELDPRVEAVLRLFSDHLKARHSLSGLARAACLSPSRLSHLFKQQTGDSVMETLLKMRLRHAAKLLEHTNRPVAEIADDVGFPNPFYFTEQFSAFYDMSPTQYRKRITERLELNKQTDPNGSL